MKRSQKDSLIFRVTSARHDISTHAIDTFQALSIQEAKEIFRKKYMNKPEYSCDYLKLLRIVQEEVTETIANLPDDSE